MKRIMLMAVLALSLAGCSLVDAAAKDVGDLFKPCSTIVANLKSDATLADLGVLAYDSLPLCNSPEGSGKACAKLSVVRKLGLYRRSAYTAINGVDSVCSSDLLSAARTAVSTFKSIAAQYSPAP